MKNIFIYLIGLVLLFSGCSSPGSTHDEPKTLADIAGAAVVLKYSMDHIEPQERWRYIGFACSDDLKKRGFNHEQMEKFAKDIISLGPYPSIEEEILAARERYKNINDANDL